MSTVNEERIEQMMKMIQAMTEKVAKIDNLSERMDAFADRLDQMDHTLQQKAQTSSTNQGPHHQERQPSGKHVAVRYRRGLEASLRSPLLSSH
jgi:division protein CdvB (Snf7/Vps24/ESCRT-III family)